MEAWRQTPRFWAVCPTMLLATALALAGCSARREQAGGYALQIQPTCEDTGKPPEEFVAELFRWETDLVPADTSLEKGMSTLHVVAYECSLCRGDVLTLSVPRYHVSEVWRFGSATEPHLIKGGFSQKLIYTCGYELAEKWWDRDQISAEAPRAWKVQLVPWNTSTVEFRDFWQLLDSVLFSQLLTQWERAAWRSDLRPTVRRVYTWYVNRYDAAVRQDPALASQQTQRERIGIIRNRLETMGADREQ